MFLESKTYPGINAYKNFFKSSYKLKEIQTNILLSYKYM